MKTLVLKTLFVIAAIVGNCIPSLAQTVFEAAEKGDLARVQVLIGQDAALSRAEDSYRKTPLHFAALRDRRAVAEYLLGKGANIDAHDKASATPLYEAAAVGGHAGMVEFLISRGADFRSNSGSGSPIRIAALVGFVDVLQVLIKSGADPKAKDSSGQTPLHSAVLPHTRPATTRPTIELLLFNGADIEAKTDQTGLTPLHLAVAKSPIETVALLLEKGASAKSRTTQTQLTPLHSVAERSWGPNTEIAALLLANGADVNAKDFLGITPLHNAAVRGVLDMVRFLVEQGADINAKDNGNTPLRYALNARKDDIANYLRSKGARE
ncbi:MAG: ankyrin repeat domain-containing protein [Reyranella sp.]